MLKIKSIFKLDIFADVMFIALYILLVGSIAALTVGLPYILCMLVDLITFYFIQWHCPFNFLTWLIAFSLIFYVRLGPLGDKPDDTPSLVEYVKTRLRK